MAIYNKIYFKLFLDNHNNIYYYHDNQNEYLEHVFQTYDIHNYDVNIGYDLDVEQNILYMRTINDSYNHGMVSLAPIETTVNAESACIAPNFLCSSSTPI